MTGTNIDRNVLRLKKTICSVLLLTGLIIFGIRISQEIADSVIFGMRLAVEKVLPSSFPFMVLADFYVAYGHPENLRALRFIASRALGIPTEAISAFVCGNIGGFPIGAHITADLYKSSIIDRKNAERLVAISSNPSIAFIMGGVGLGMYESLSIGYILIISVYFSMLITSLILKSNQLKSKNSVNIFMQNYDFTRSIKKTGASCISLIAIISIFSAFISIAKKYIKSSVALILIASVSEVTNAVYLSSESNLPLYIKIAISAFALGFGGLSVMLQSASFFADTDVKFKKYILFKLLQGMISAAVSLLIYLIL